MKVQSQDGYTTINRIPSLTWNRLHVNEAEGASIGSLSGKTDVKLSFSGEEPELIMLSESSYPDQATGVGQELSEAVSLSKAEISHFTFAGGSGKAVLDFSYSGKNESIYPVEIEVKDNASAEVVMIYSSSDDAEGQAAVQTKYRLGKGASLRLIQIQKLSSEMEFFNDIGGSCDDEAEFSLIQLVFSGKRSYYGSITDLCGKRSVQKTAMAYLVGEGELLDINDAVNHIGKKTESDIRVNGVLSKGAEKTFRGTIDLRRGAKGAVGNETEDVLLMDEDVVNRTVPVILCTEEDVEGNHGATIGRPGDDILFYLESRGIDEKSVYELMAKARIDSVKRLIEDEEILKRIEDLTDEDPKAE